jgi:nicotinate-nucleotide adenylyltransferase
VRIAIIGGTFDPIHNGHLAAAQSVASTFQVDEVHFVPAFVPPHKQLQQITSPFHRFTMVALATMPFAQFRTSTIEVDTLEKRYTVDTLQSMKQIYPGADLLFVVGTDMYQELRTWKDFQRLFELAHIVIVNRPGFPLRTDIATFRTLQPHEFAVLPDKTSVFYLPFVEQPISSTAIRAALADSVKRGNVASQSLPSQVWSYIEKNKLYS